MLSLLAVAVLFVACANVAGLLASRAPMRAREIALRLAIGAGPGRVTRQLMTESVLIAAIGGVLGLGVGYAGVLLFRQFRIPTDLPISVAFELDQRALAVSLMVTLVSAVLFGLAPAVRAARADLTVVMKAADAAGSGRRRWGRAILVAGQVAVSVILLTVSVFVYRDFQRRIDEGPGFRTDHLLEMWFTPGVLQYSQAQTQEFFEQVVEQARNMPGAASATLTSFVLMDGGNGTGLVQIAPEAFQLPAGTKSVVLFSATVDDQFFDTLKLPILKGRPFRATDAADAPRVAIVNEQVAARYWPGQDPVGKRFHLNEARGPVVEVVGLTTTTKYSFLLEGPTEFIYFPLRQRPQQSLALIIASKGDPAMMAGPIREMVRHLDANQPISNLRPLEETYRMRSVTILNVLAALIAAMGTMGLLLAIVGLYGLVSYAASRRTKEIGIRIAIGAEPFDVLRMVLSQGATLAVVGLVVGLLASVGVNRALGALFPREDGHFDTTAVALVAMVVMSVTLLATYLPARRASRVNPIEALRCE